MKIVIEIPDEKYNWLKENNPNPDNNSFIGYIINGTPYEEKPQGKYIPIDKLWLKCSNCGNLTRNLKKYNIPNFCPACGAEMFKEK